MKIKYFFLFIIILSCQSPRPQVLKKLLGQFEAELPLVFPDYAAAMGIPQATDILVIPTQKKLEENLSFCQKYLASFEGFEQLADHPELNEQRIEKVEILTGMIQRMTGPRSPFNDPGFYNVYSALAWRNSQLRQFPDSIKTNLLLKTLNKIPLYFSHAKTNIDDPNIVKTIAAIDLQEKTFDFLTTTITERIDSLPETSRRKRLKIAKDDAAIAVKNYTAFCKRILVELKKLE